MPFCIVWKGQGTTEIIRIVKKICLKFKMGLFEGIFKVILGIYLQINCNFVIYLIRSQADLGYWSISVVWAVYMLYRESAPQFVTFSGLKSKSEPENSHGSRGCCALTLLLCPRTGENAIVIVAGANMQLGSKELQEALPAISRTKVLVCQLEISPQISLQALRMAQENKGQWAMKKQDVMT